MSPIDESRWPYIRRLAGFTLGMREAGTTPEGRTTYEYALWDDDWPGAPIFEGSDFKSGVGGGDYAADSLELLGFLSLKPGDTDAEYFNAYDSRQLSWAKERGEELSLLASDEERRAAPRGGRP